MKNKSKYALLGLLSIRPMTGYDMKKFINEGLRFFWTESFGNIYPTLKKLEKENLAEKTIEQRLGKSDRIIYKITKTGLDELQKWLMEATEVAIVRDEHLLKLFFSKELTVEEIIKQVNYIKQKINLDLKVLREMEISFEKKSNKSKQDLLFYIILRKGIIINNASVAWCEESIKNLLNYEYV